MTDKELDELAYDSYLGNVKVIITTDGYTAYKEGFINAYKYFQEQQKEIINPLDPRNYNQELVYPPNSIKD